jgi:hypothetical protein
VSDKKRFLLRLEPELYASLERWAADDLRSINAQIEFLLKEAVRRNGRHKPPARPEAPDG